MRKSLEQLKSNFRLILLFSLWIGLIKSIFDILSFAITPPSYVIAIPLFTGLIFASQIWAISNRKTFTWIFSAIHAVSIFFFSVGTFGYLFVYLLRAFAIFQPAETYATSGLLVLSEILKTIYLHRAFPRAYVKAS